MEPLTPIGGQDDDETVEPEYYAGLTDKQRRFVEEYVKDCNATQSAIRAGYSKDTANQQGPRLLVNVGIRKAIDALLDSLTMSTEEAMFRLTAMARGTVEPFIEAYGRGFKFDFTSEQAQANWHLVKEIGQTQNGAYIKIHDQKDALFKLMQIRGKVASDKADDPAKGNGKPKVLLYMPDNGRRKPPGYVPPLPLPETNTEQ